MAGPSKGVGEVSVKVEKWSDGLNEEQRQAVVDEINTWPDVMHAYLTRLVPSLQQTGRPLGGHIKIIFSCHSPCSPR